MELEAVDAITKFGALGALLYLIPILRGIARSLEAIAGDVAGAAGGVIAGAQDAGVDPGAPPTMRGAVAGTIRHLAGPAAALLVAIALAGCSCSSSVARGLADLERDLGDYVAASAPADDVDAEAHEDLGAALLEHVREARMRAEQ